MLGLLVSTLKGESGAEKAGMGPTDVMPTDIARAASIEVSFLNFSSWNSGTVCPDFNVRAKNLGW